MKKSILRFNSLLMWLLAMAMISCVKEPYEPQAFVFATSIGAKNIAVGVVELQGQLVLGSETTEEMVRNSLTMEYGFVYATERLSDFHKGDTTMMAFGTSLPPDRVFSESVSGLPLEQHYFEAYVIATDASGQRRTSFGEILTVNLAEVIEISIDQEVMAENDEATLSGVVILSLVDSLTDRGFICLPNDPIRPIELPQDTNTFISLGGVRRDGEFSHRLTDLNFNTDYYCWAYAIAGGELVITDESAVLEVGGGWKLRGVTNPRNIRAIGAAVGGDTERGFFGLGCRTRCLRSEALKGSGFFWEYDLDNDSLVSIDLPLESPSGRRDGVAFVLGEEMYFGLGLAGGEFDGAYFQDFWSYDPTTGQWEELPDFPGGGRTGAIGFAVGSKGYVGAGYSISDYSEVYHNDFYEYDPAARTWKPMTDPLPTKSGQDSLEFGRRNATAFVDGQGKAFVGLGLTIDNAYNFILLNDLWEFNPDEGPTWAEASGGSITPRESLVSVMDGQDVFMGLGIDESNFRDDFYRWNSNTSSWDEMTPFPRSESEDLFFTFAMAVQGRIFVGGHRDFSASEFLEVWEFFPSN